MSMGTNGDRPSEQVIDEDKNVDAQLKRQIVTLRKEVRDAERLLFVEANANPQINISPADQITSWGTVVKQYIRMVEPLLRADTIEQSSEYYEQAELGRVVLTPPDTDGYKFSRVGISSSTGSQLRREIGLPRGAEIPKPQVKQFIGLRSVIEMPEVLSHEWAVDVSGSEGKPGQSAMAYPSTSRVVPKEIYETAFRKTNLFLQKAGVGLDVDDDSMPAIRNFDMSGDEPMAEFGTDDYETPDI